MLQSYFTLAFRNLWKRKTTTIINVLGLSVGLACCALVFLFVQHELGFDKGFDGSTAIYRVTSTFDDGGNAPTVAMPYATYLKTEIPEIENVSRLDTKCQCIVQVNNGAASTPYTVDNGYWVDTTFFKIFSFHFLQGNRQTAFAAPNTIVLSQSLAKKFFGNVYPIGKTLKIANGTYTVSGVFKEDMLNHFKADFFASNNSEGIEQSDAVNTSWVTNPNYYTYLKLKPNSNYAHVLKEINAYTLRHATADMKSSGIHMQNGLQALLAIHLHSSQYQSYLEVLQVNINYLYFLSCVAFAILLLGCINYMNLSSAQAVDRAREVGVRRVMGAGKASIRYQFMIETITLSLAALVVAIGLGFIFLPAFNILTGQTLSFFAVQNRSLILWMLLVALGTGILAGIYPALYLSAFKPIKVLKGSVVDSPGLFNVRRVLVSLQFVIATCLVFASLVIWAQFDLLRNINPGFDQDQQLVLNEANTVSQLRTAYLIRQLSVNPLFKSVTGATSALISGDMNLYQEGKTVADKHDVFMNYVDDNYVNTLSLKLIAGTNFTPTVFANKDMQQDWETNDIGRQVILNEEAVKALGLDPYSAPGKYLQHKHNGLVYTYKIMGVVKDYHYLSMHNVLGAYGIMPINPMRFSTIIAKIKSGSATTGIKFASQKWKEINPETPFNYGFLDKVFAYDYDQDQRQQTMLGAFTLIAILISCLGLFGLITYTLGRRAREIGIRKVIGASVANIVMLFYKQYFKLVLVANLVALPLAWYYMDSWLRSFPYRVNISWWVFVLALSTGIVVAFLTIAFKTMRAASVNPVNSLKAE